MRIEDWQALGLEGEQGTNELHTAHAFAAARALAPKPAPAAALRVAALRVATLRVATLRAEEQCPMTSVLS